MYERKIIYLHRYEGEMDKGNAGYIKQESCNGTCTFTVVLMNLPPGYKAETFLKLSPSDYSLCKVHISSGTGQGLAICEEKVLQKEGVLVDEIAGYQMIVNDNVVISGKPSLIKKGREEVKPIERSEVIENTLIEKSPLTEENQIKPQEATLPYEAPKEIFKTKWEQLSYGKKRVNLMGKESDYIEITPSDMIALSNPYHSLVNNAFLLHGYYNYKHLILGPAKGQRSTFLIGVPGNFYKQEVNAARMFGFEYFENGGNKVEVGDFGYYMKKVKL